MPRARLQAAVTAVGVALALAGCDLGGDGEPAPREDPRAALVRAAQRTVDAGPAAMVATVRSGGVRHRLSGRLAPRPDGYRFCGAVATAGGGFPDGRSLWLEDRRGAHATLTAGGRGCAPAATWLDDHPPTLELRAGLRGPGAEDLLHAVLTAFRNLRDAAVREAESCDGSGCIRATVDFGRLDRRPPMRDEDAWTLRPLLRSLGRHPVTFRLDDGGRHVERIILRAHVRGRDVVVSVSLSDFGRAQPVPRMGTGPLAME